MNDTTHVKGLKELDEVLEQAPPKIQRNVLRGSLRAGMNVVKPVAQSNVHSESGLLAAGLKVGTRARGTTVTANLKATGAHAHVAPWVEYGTKPHTIKASPGKAMMIGGMYVQSVEHPGARPHPFMRPALDSQAQAAVIGAAEYMKARLATKHGLDTAHITIEGDQ